MARIRDGVWELFDWDPYTGRTVWHYFDGQTDHFRVDYPVDSLLKQNEIERNESERGWKGDWHKVASVPAPLFFGMGESGDGLLKALKNGDDKWVRRWLNDSDNRAWRTKEGQL